jgi:hypothetical protein
MGVGEGVGLGVGDAARVGVEVASLLADGPLHAARASSRNKLQKGMC